MTKKQRIIPIAIAGVAVPAIAAWLLFFGHGSGVPPVYSVDVVKSYPHDPQAFTEGLFYQDGKLYESTGEAGTSGIRRTRLDSGEVELQQDLPPPYFGEGIIAWKDKMVQLTWQDHVGFVYSLGDFTPRDQFAYKGEGWGLTQNGKQIIMSDGTPVLRFLDPETLKQVSTLKVTVAGCPVEKLNELEWIDGEIYANIWQTSLIARIDPATGVVKSFLDIGALAPHSSDPDAVANGIAYDAGAKRLFVTGKLWPELFEIRAGAKQAASEAAAALAKCAK
jgi:glutaminyl-peptide cyclotransferase